MIRDSRYSTQKPKPKRKNKPRCKTHNKIHNMPKAISPQTQEEYDYITRGFNPTELTRLQLKACQLTDEIKTRKPREKNL